METKFNFNSQICTTIEQSERLLAIGLKKETADMVYHSYGYIIDEFGNKERRFKQPTLVVDGWESKYDIPAWSLHRLIEMMPEDVNCDNVSEYFTIGKDFFAGHYVTYGQLFWKEGTSIYDNILDCIEWLIKEGDFNKEYLEE